ncbi:MAG: dihydrodipicolinate synthase family protein [Verrucomicrobiota bacterium]
MKPSPQRPYHGIIPPLVTPLSGSDELDEPGLKKLIDHLCDGEVHGLFILGTTGEAPSLSHPLRRKMIEHSCKFTEGRLPILVGITDTSFIESVELAHHAAKCGADAVVVAPPYYLPPGQPELLEYLNDLIAELPLPCMLYNMPPLTKVQIGSRVVEQLLDNQGIVGLKDSSGDMSYFHHIENIAHQAGKWSVLMGSELLMMDSVLSGGDGGVTGGANLFPRFFSAAYQAAASGDLDSVQQMQKTMIHLQQLYSIGQHASAGIKGIKCALEIVGICSTRMAEPFRRFEMPEKQSVHNLLNGLRKDPLLTKDFASLDQF